MSPTGAPPFPFCRPTEADLQAARLNLMAWEDPRHPSRAALFWADAPMVEARILDAADAGDHALRHVVRRPGATLMGLRLRDGTLVGKVSRGRRTKKCKAQTAL